MEPTSKKLLDRVRDAIRLKHYSIRTEQSYINWIKRYIFFHNVRHPDEMGAAEVEAFLTHLAVNENVAASTQNQALSALLFLYREVLKKDLGPIDALRAKKPKRLPTVLTKEEVHRVLGELSGMHRLTAKLLYGSGLRLMECLRLRVKDDDLCPRPRSGWPGHPQPTGLACPISRRASSVDLLARPAAPQVHEDTPRVDL